MVCVKLWENILSHNSIHYYNNGNTIKVNDGTKLLDYLNVMTLSHHMGSLHCNLQNWK